MGSKPTVALAVTVHEPGGRLANMMRAQLPSLMERYSAVTAWCSQATHPTVSGLLRDHGVAIQIDGKEPSGIEGIGRVRRDAIGFGLLANASHLQMCDFDRALHWVAHYPGELDGVIADIPRYDLLVLGRTQRAWDSHPAYQVETESLFNHVFALVTGLPWDVGAGSRGLSRRAAETLLEASKEETVGTDAEWPLLLLNQQDFSVGYRHCEGLEFETADRFGPEIEAAGGYEAWEAGMSADPGRWVFRMRLSLMIAEAIVRYGRPRPGSR
jgi:hypothetical protein